MKKSVIVLMSLTILATIIGFTRDLILSYFYGASSITDAYIVSLTIPNTIIAFIGAAIGSIFIPMYKNIEFETNEEKANEYTSKVINLILIISGVIVILVLIFAPFLVKIFAIGFKGETFELAVKFTRISVVSIIFSCLCILFNNYLQLKEKFIITGLMSIPLNLGIIISILISIDHGIYILSIGSAISVCLQLLFLIPFVIKSRFRYKFFTNIFDENTKKLLSKALPVMLGVSVYQLNILVDKAISSQLITGGITILTYADKINSLVFGIIAVPMATVLYPMFSKIGAENNMELLNQYITKALITIMLLVIPITIGIIILSDPIIQLLFGRGAFDDNTVYLTSKVLLYYSIGLLGISIREILYRAFYSIQDTKTPLINAGIAMLINIILSLILSRIMGIAGVALATSISAIFCSFLLLINFKKRMGVFSFKKILSPLLKILMVSVIMGIFTLIIFRIINDYYQQLFFALSISVICSCVIYLLIIKFMNIKEFEEIFVMVKKKF